MNKSVSFKLSGKAKHIASIREEAKKLKEQTKEELKRANDEIEKILLG